MSGSVGAFVGQVDRLLGAGQRLFAVSNGPVAVDAAAPDTASVPGRGGLSTAVNGAADNLRRAWLGVRDLDAQTNGAARQGSSEAERGRAGAADVRSSAHAQAAAITPSAGSVAGVRALVSAMDERLGAMQREIDTTRAQHRLLAARLRRMAALYRLTAAVAPVGLGARGAGAGHPAVGYGGGALRPLAGLAGARPGLGGRDATAGGVSGGLGSSGIAAGPIPLGQVSFAGKGAWTGGRRAIRGYLDEALDRMGIRDRRARANWADGMMTIADHESSFRTDAINLSDTNAWGPGQVDGGPLHATRGPWQVMPDTFARFHQPGTSNSVWDPVANACASMNYQMSRYGVAADGHNQRALVAQANPGVRQGY